CESGRGHDDPCCAVVAALPADPDAAARGVVLEQSDHCALSAGSGVPTSLATFSTSSSPILPLNRRKAGSYLASAPRVRWRRHPACAAVGTPACAAAGHPRVLPWEPRV